MNKLELPGSFIERMRLQLGSESESFFSALLEAPPVSIRLNPGKKISVSGELVPWCANGVYLPERPVFTLDPLFHAGCYYVQEASSMFLEQVFIQLELDKKPLAILDACAAPGGKSTHLASLMNSNSLLVSNETVGSRVSVLKENLIKWGAPDVVISRNDPSAFSTLEKIFDVIVVDAPCSGEGLFRKDPTAVQEWSDSGCDLCASRQQRIINDLMPALKPGGVFIYCTCTYNPAENEDNLKLWMKKFSLESIPLRLDHSWNILENKSGDAFSYSFYPHRTKGEGFFISVLKKNGAENLDSPTFRSKSRKKILAEKKFQHVESWIRKGEKVMSVFWQNDQLFAVNERWETAIDFLAGKLSLVHSGLLLGETKGDKVIPSHELALSTLINTDSFPSLELSLPDSLKYLRKENFERKPDEKGWTLITHQQHPLGWINALDTRVNNYYPVGWRIRMQ